MSREHLAWLAIALIWLAIPAYVAGWLALYTFRENHAQRKD